VAVDIALPGGAIDPSTATPTAIYLIDDATGQAVPAAVTVSGGGDAITLTPRLLLAAEQSYTFVITSEVLDVAGNAFVPFTAGFTTGIKVAESLPEVAFTQTPQTSTIGTAWTGVEFGPDGKLYATTANGEVHRFDVNADGSLSAGTLLAALTEPDGVAPRLITGIAFDTSAAGLVAYVSHGQFVDPGDDSDRTADDWTGKITRLSGADLQNELDIIVGLPRSVYDHLNNQPVFGPDGRLYFVVPSNTAMGAPDNTWGNRPERLLTAAILAADVRSITGTVDVKTEDGGTYDPYAPNAPVQLYATGIRNVYDLVWTPAGHLYAPSNGSAAGGNTPGSPDGSVPAINGVTETQNDVLYRVVEGGYYGHPNPVRGEYVLAGGNPTFGADVGEISQYPVGTQPEAGFVGFVHDFGQNVSPNGVVRYDSGGVHFGGALDGMLLVTRYSGGDDVMFIQTDEATGTVTRTYAGGNGLGGLSDPLDLDVDPATGFIYVVEAGFRTNGGNLQITLLTPVDAGTLADDAPTRDFGNGPTLFFNAVTSTNETISFTLTNDHATGTIAFPSDALTLLGDDRDFFRVVSGDPAETTLAPGESITITLEFDPDAVRIFDAELHLRSNDPASPDRVIRLRGLGTSGEGGNDEPSLQRLFDLYEIPIVTGDPDASTTDYPQQADVANSDEVLAQLLTKAGDGPVTIELLSSFGTSNANAFTDTSALAWYAAGNPGSANDLFAIDKVFAQTIRPEAVGTQTFDPTGDFGLVATFFDFGPRDVYSEDTLNTWESEADERRKVRFFHLLDTDGNVVPNAYVFTFEEWDVATDQNDLVGIIRNVTPAVLGEARLENLAAAPSNDFLAFNKIRDLDPVLPNAVREFNTVRIHNDGSGSLTLFDATISSTDFEVFTDLQTPVVIQPGDFFDIDVRFVFEGDGSERVEIRQATLTISTSDENQPAIDIGLGGLWQRASEQIGFSVSQEANLAELVRAFGYQIDVGPDTGLSDYDTGTNTGGSIDAVGQETISAYWEKAGPGNVEVVQLAAFHQQRDPQWDGTGSPRYNPNTAFFWHDATDAVGSESYSQLFRHKIDEGQTILPLLENGSGVAMGTFDPGSAAFGFAVERIWHSDPARNEDRTPDNSIDESGFHSFRWFAVYDHNGNLIPDTYLVGQDNVGDGGNLHTGGSYRGSNFDYQDNVYLVRNVRPVSGPSAVDNVAAGGSQSGVSLTWDASSEGNVGSYVVRRAEVAGSFVDIATVSDGTTFLDTTAAPGTTYRYQIVAVDYHGTVGTASAEVSVARPVAPSVPAAASSLVASAPDHTAVVLTWTDVANDETGYRVERRIDGGTFALLTTLDADATGYTDTTVAGATLYDYRVIAFNSAGDAPAAGTSVTTPADLSAAVALSATATSFDRVELAWNDASDNEAGFRIERAGSDGVFALLVELPAGTETFSDTTVIAETEYSYRVVTLGSGGTVGGTSAVATVTTPTDPADIAAPTNLMVVPSWNNAIVSWQHDGEQVTHFEIRRDNVIVATLGAGARTWTDSTVQPETTYAYDIRALNVVDATTYTGPLAGPLSVTTPRNPADLAAPANLTAEAVTRSQVNLTWDAVPSAEFFVVERRVSGGSWQVLSDAVPSSQTSFIDNQAAPATTFEYRVRARNAFNPASAPYASVTVTTVAADVLIGSAIGSATGAVAGDNDAFTITATGTNDNTDLGDDDDIYFAHRLFVGDFDVILQVDSFDKAAPASAVGLMVRDDLSPTSTNVALRYSGDVAMSWRSTVGGETRPPTGTTTGPDSPFLRLVRTGDTFTGYVSADGLNWTVVATSDTIPMGASVRVGGFVASYSPNASTAALADFGTYQQQPPVAPTGLVATPGDAIALAWVDASPNELGFRVERRVTGDTAWQVLETLDAGSTAFTDLTATGGTTYEYRVVSFNAAGETASPIVSAVRADDRPGSPGDGVTPPAASAESRDVSLQWPAADGDVLGYLIERRTPGGEWSELARTSTCSTSLRDATAETGSTYEYRVRAFNDDGTGQPSAVITLTTPAALDATPPTLSTTRTESGVLVSWTGDDAVVLQRRLDNGNWITLGRFDGNTALDEATSDRDVDYRVRREADLNGWSDPVAGPAVASTTRDTGSIGNATGDVRIVRDFEHIDLSATGGDAWGFEDAIQFAGFRHSGDFDVGVRVHANGSGNWMAGLVARSSGDAGASNVFLKLRDNDVRLTARGTDDGQTAVVGDTDQTPGWLRLVRRGDDLIGLVSSDGMTWTEVGRTRVDLGDVVSLGVAGAGGSNGSVDVRFREFRHFVQEQPPADVDARPTPTGIAVSWSPVNHALQYRLDRRPVGGAWETLAQLTSTSYSDTSTEDGVRYSYRVYADASPASEPTEPVAS
ncbi:MAG: Ig-like domain-containing protein, partial [Planctomycetota bacterium]